jgi:CheY-like chemotaxis protein
VAGSYVLKHWNLERKLLFSQCWLITMIMEDQSGPAPSKHVLVVDDDIQLALTFQALLQVYGYRVSTAADGAQALKVVLNSDVDAILCDLQMPELTGDLFYVEVGRLRPHLLKRFIFITGNADEPLYQTFLKSVKAPLLSKPVSIDRLLGKLKAVLEAEAGSAK